jgi:hypothetical protein
MRRAKSAFCSRGWDGKQEEERKRRTSKQSWNNVEAMKEPWRVWLTWSRHCKILREWESSSTWCPRTLYQSVRAGMPPRQDEVPLPNADMGLNSLCLCFCYWWLSKNILPLKWMPWAWGLATCCKTFLVALSVWFLECYLLLDVWSLYL